MMKPEPSEVPLRGWASGRPLFGTPCSKKSRKNSSNGDPGGNCGISGPLCSRPRSDFTVWVVEILTTAGSSFAARSAKLSGAGRASAGGTTAAIAAINKTAAALAAARRARFVYGKGTSVNSSERRRTIILCANRRSFVASGVPTGRRASRNWPIVSPRSPPHQPDENDPGAGGREPSQSQGLGRNGERARRRPFHAFGEQGVEGTLDHQDESERRRQIPHCPPGGAPKIANSQLALRFISPRPSVAASVPGRFCLPLRPNSRKSGKSRYRVSVRRTSCGRSARRDRPASSDRTQRSPYPGRKRRHRS